MSIDRAFSQYQTLTSMSDSDILTQEEVLLEEDIDLLDELVDQKQLVVHNDEVNTFDWVIKALVEICKHSEQQAEQCSLIIHFKGKASVRSGSMDKLRPMKDGLTDRGINATIE